MNELLQRKHGVSVEAGMDELELWMLIAAPAAALVVQAILPQALRGLGRLLVGVADLMDRR